MAYSVSKQQSDQIFVYLRITIFEPYFLHLKQLKQRFTSNSEMFFYLIGKYHYRLNQLIKRKKSSKRKYQEVTNNYLNIGIKVAPAVHQILKDLSDVTGYSISAIVRFLIEWECLNQFSQEVVLEYTPICEIDESLMIVITSFCFTHNYYIDLELVEEKTIWEYG